MKESKYSLDSRVVFRETFNSQDDVNKNGGTLGATATISNGQMGIITTTSVITYPKLLKGTFSVRIKTNQNTQGVFRYLIELGTGGANYVAINSSNNIQANGTPTYYVNGIAGAACPYNTNLEIIVSGVTWDNIALTPQLRIGSAGFPPKGTIDLIEIYQGTLTATEVASLYKNELYKAPTTNIVLDIDPNRGYINDAKGHTVTTTAINLIQDGCLVADHNNTSTSAITVSDSNDLSFGDGAGNDRPFSVGVRVKMTGSNGGNRNFLYKSSEWNLYISGQFTFSCYVFGSSAYIGRYSNFSASPNRRYYLVATYDGTKVSTGVKIYSDGVRVDAGNYQSGTYTGMTNTTNAVSTLSSYTKRLGRSKVWNKELTLTEIQREYQSQKNLYR